jgi:hypothetical protein
VPGADPVDAAVSLHQAHRVPRKVVVDDVAGLLQVDAFGEDIGGDDNVVAVRGVRWGVDRLSGARSPRAPRPCRPQCR